MSVPDLLDDLQQLSATPPVPREHTEEEYAGSLRPFEELSDHFHGKKDKDVPGTKLNFPALC